MNTDDSLIREQYEKIYKGDEHVINDLMNRNCLELKEVKGCLGELIDYLPNSVESSVEKISSTLSIKAKKVAPY